MSKLYILIMLASLSSYAIDQDLYIVKTGNKGKTLTEKTYKEDDENLIKKINKKGDKPLTVKTDKEGNKIINDMRFNKPILVKFNAIALKSEDVNDDDRGNIEVPLHRRNHEAIKKTVDRLISSQINESSDVWELTLNLKNLELLPEDLYKDGYKNNFKTENIGDNIAFYDIEIDPKYNLIFASMFHRMTLLELISALKSLIKDVRDGKRITGLSLITIDVTRDYILEYIDNILKPTRKLSEPAINGFRNLVQSLIFGKEETLAMSDENLDRLIKANEEKVIQAYSNHYSYKNYSYRYMLFNGSSFFQALIDKIYTFDSCSTREINIINLVWREISQESRDLVSEKLGVAIGPEGNKKYINPWDVFKGELSVNGEGLPVLQVHKHFLSIASQVEVLTLVSSNMSAINQDFISAWLSPEIPLKTIQLMINEEVNNCLTIDSNRNSCTVTLINGIPLNFDFKMIKLLNDKITIKEIIITDTYNIQKIGQIGASLQGVKKLLISGVCYKIIELDIRCFIILVNFLFPNLENLILKDLQFYNNGRECKFEISKNTLEHINLLEFYRVDHNPIKVEIVGKTLERTDHRDHISFKVVNLNQE